MVTMSDYCDADGNIIITTRPEYDIEIGPLTGKISKEQRDNPKGVWTLFPFTQEKISRKKAMAVPEIPKVHNAIWHLKHSPVKQSGKTQEDIMEQIQMDMQERVRKNAANNPFMGRVKGQPEAAKDPKTETTPKVVLRNKLFNKLRPPIEDKKEVPVAVEENKPAEVPDEELKEQPAENLPAVPPIMSEQDFGDEDPAIAAAEARANAAKPEAESVEKPIEEHQEEKSETPKEETVVEATAEQPSEEPVQEDVSKAPVSEDKKEEPVKKTRKSVAKKTTENKPSEELFDYSVNVPDLDKIEADTSLLFASYTTADFRNEMQRILKAVRDIQLSEDMNPGVVQVRVSQICALYDEIDQHYSSVKIMMDNILNKDGIIMASAAAQTEGTNEFERKKSMNKILMNFPMDNTVMNMLEIKTVLGIKKTFYEQVIATLDKKRSSIMSCIGNMKVEASFTR